MNKKLLILALIAIFVAVVAAGTAYSEEEYSYDYDVEYDTAPALASALAASCTTYTVRSGDTLGAIASRYGTTANAIKALNPIITNINVIQVGWVLKVKCDGPSPTPTPTPTPSGTYYGKYNYAVDYKQCDNSWRNTPIAQGGTVCSIGCLITSIATSMKSRGHAVTPYTMATRGSFTPGGAFYHGSVSNVVSGSYFIDTANGSAGFNTVKSWLQKDYTVVVSIRNWGHYLPVWAVDSAGVYVRDPANQTNKVAWGSVTGYKLYHIP